MKKQSFPFKYKLEYFVLLIVRFIAMAPSVSVAEWFGRRLGDCMWYLFPYRYQIMMYNMDIVFPNKTDEEKLCLAHKVYQFFGEMIIQFFSQDKKANRKRIKNADVTGIDYLNNAFKRGKGSILNGIHFGNWEFIASWMNIQGIPSAAIYKPMKNPLSDAFFLTLRKKMGHSMKMISTREGMKAYEKALHENRALAIAVDQNAHKRGVKVPFFHNTTSIAKGTAVLKYRTDAEIIGMVPLYENKKFSLHFFPIYTQPIETLDEKTIAQTMEQVMKSFEPWITRYPTQWMWFHKLWGKPKKKYKRTLGQILKY
ncbi:MAG: hypothetical protein PHE86_04085 [Candidatus Marinimicrobia bacterium]|nr:hypothetical protein [Candidatus Neomarinimicrobiota bacterium]MDD5581951.1 hypothetical protein [Candidatus Neomarinimicrobiota bacterium]